MENPPIVVGIEATGSAADALRWAAWQSQRSGAPMIVVHAYPPEPPAASREVRATRESVARSWATHWVRQALATCGALPWRTMLVVTGESPADALVRLSATASMLVLGQRLTTRGGSPSAITERCERDSGCPVVVVSEGTSLEEPATTGQRGVTGPEVPVLR
jgi:nucleotide-binding universal stress UspA family protein